MTLIITQYHKWACYYESFSFTIYPMIICICKNINTSQLRDGLQRGLSLDDITDEMGLGTGCGSCLEYASSMIQKELPIIARESAA